MHSRPRPVPRILLLTAVLVFLSSSLAHAQWVFVARKALKVINSVAGELQSPGQGEAVDAGHGPARGGCRQGLRRGRQAGSGEPGMRVLSQDAPRRAIAFAKGEQSAS